MKSLLAAAHDLLTFLNSPVVIAGIICAILGFGIAVLSRRITRIFRSHDEIADDDKIFRAIKITGIVLILAGFVMMPLVFVI